jgi:diadenosine tetraphosphate (Ap4A) HIT family hydrolase
MSELTLFHKIVAGDIPARIVWEDEQYMAFLTPFPNTEGFTVVIPKSYKGDYAFAMEEDDYTDFMRAVKKVARLLEKAFDTSRVALVFEGTGVAYVHAKLIPLHGELASQTNVWSKHQEFYPEYVGYLTTVEGPKMSDEQLDSIQAKIRSAA